VIFGAPYWVQSYLAVCVNDCCPVFVTVFLLLLYDLKCFHDSQLSSPFVRTPVVLLEFELFREDLPCKYSKPRSHSLFALATVREDMPQLVLAVVFCVVDAEYTNIRRVNPVPWVLCFVNLVLLVLSAFVMLYSWTTSSTLMFIVVSSVRMQSASWDMLRFALAILKLIYLSASFRFHRPLW
jgi:hypothetical protein